MNWLETKYLAETKRIAWSVAFLAVVTMMLAAPRSSAAQAMQKGISVELAPTSSAAPMPDADKQDASIVAVSASGKFYFGIDPVAPDSLEETIKNRASHRTLYIKADARAPYACVVKVLDAAHSAGVTDVTLLTAQPETKRVGTIPPEGIEMELTRRSAAAAK